MSSYVGLFRARFPFVCESCDLGYRKGRLARQHADGRGRLECARCAYGHDPDVDEGAPTLMPALSDPREVPDYQADTPPEPPPALF